MLHTVGDEMVGVEESLRLGSPPLPATALAQEEQPESPANFTPLQTWDANVRGTRAKLVNFVQFILALERALGARR